LDVIKIGLFFTLFNELLSYICVENKTN
jgi:hypothetical protein